MTIADVGIRHLRDISWVNFHFKTEACWRNSSRVHHHGSNFGFRCVYSVNNKPSISLGVSIGGAWSYCNHFAGAFNTHYRDRAQHKDWYNSLGFRCVYPRIESGSPKNA